jgi:cytochrome b
MPHVRVWDLPTRLFHWLLALCIIGSFVTVKVGGNWMQYHFWFGYSILALIAFRILWGFVGTRYARFASFPPNPLRTLAYLRDGHANTLGHNPLGAWSVYALLLVVGAQAIGGLFADDEIANAGPLSKLVSNAMVSTITSLHKLNEWVILALILVHVGAVLYYLYKKRENLITPMITGDKYAPHGGHAAADNVGTRAFAVALLAACAAGVWWVVNR